MRLTCYDEGVSTIEHPIRLFGRDNRENVASASGASVSGSFQNAANADYASVSGGASRTAAGVSDWKAGGLFEDQ